MLDQSACDLIVNYGRENTSYQEGNDGCDNRLSPHQFLIAPLIGRGDTCYINHGYRELATSRSVQFCTHRESVLYTALAPMSRFRLLCHGINNFSILMPVHLLARNTRQLVLTSSDAPISRGSSRQCSYL